MLRWKVDFMEMNHFEEAAAMGHKEMKATNRWI